MNKAVRSTALRRDETITLGGIEKLYGADWHRMFPFTKTKDGPPAKIAGRAVEA
jgi:hypothetical protein